MINAWSYSSLTVFEKCPYQAKLKYIDKIPEPKNQFSERGIQLHSAAEEFVKGGTPTLHPELKHFAPELESLVEQYAKGKVEVEQEWAHDRHWNTSDWRSKETWARLKLDFFVKINDTTGCVIDLKSGKRFGNEIKHTEQGQLYAGSAFLRYPQLTRVITEFWYLDHNEMSSVEYKPSNAAKFIASFDKRAARMTSAKTFPARPSIFTCKYCPYRSESTGGSGLCKFAPEQFTQPAKKQWR